MIKLVKQTGNEKRENYQQGNDKGFNNIIQNFEDFLTWKNMSGIKYHKIDPLDYKNY